MVWALLGIAIAGFGFAATAVALGIRAGSLKADVMSLELERDAALQAVAKTDERTEELEQIIESRGIELQLLYDELETCGTDEQRARSAVAGIRLMLPAFSTKETDSDHD